MFRVNPLSTVYRTTRFNSAITAAGRKFSKHGGHRFYRIGGVVSVVLMILAACILLVNPFLVLRGWLAGGAAEANTRQIVSPMVPGVNVPLSSVVYLVLAVFIAGLVHELGHALAAVVNDVDVCGTGFFLYAIFPGFFVDIDERVCCIPHKEALSVFAAGVWHNLLLCCVCLLVIVQPQLLLFPLFTVPHTGVVTGIPQDSVLAGHLMLGDSVLAVNGCPVTGAAEWAACITELFNNPPAPGYCAPTASPSVKELPVDEIDVTQWAPTGTNEMTDECCVKEGQGHGECFKVYRTIHSV